MLKKNKRKFFIAGIILFVAVGYLSFMGFQSSAAYYYSVSEVLSQPGTLSGKVIRINGQVLPGSIEQKPGDLKFTVTQDGQNLPVVYQGVVPDTFKPGGDVVVEGTLDSANVFQAKVLMPKCPSKYVPVG